MFVRICLLHFLGKRQLSRGFVVLLVCFVSTTASFLCLFFWVSGACLVLFYCPWFYQWQSNWLPGKTQSLKWPVMCPVGCKTRRMLTQLTLSCYFIVIKCITLSYTCLFSCSLSHLCTLVSGAFYLYCLLKCGLLEWQMVKVNCNINSFVSNCMWKICGLCWNVCHFGKPLTLIKSVFIIHRCQKT